jgi:ATP-dependent 26S proteasome regulatory subunit|eukprot:COSAG01_NODE_14685_length_1419_cov_1.058957_3_plen_121_part_00
MPAGAAADWSGVEGGAVELQWPLQVEFKHPDRKGRAKLWELSLPATVPRAEDVDFGRLAQASVDFSLVQIGNAVYRAAAVAALRPAASRRVQMADLETALEEEKRRGESEVDRFVAAQYM